MKIANRVIEIDKAGRDHGQRHNGEIFFFAGADDVALFFGRDGHRLSEDIHAVESDTRDMLQANGGIHTDLVEGAINDAKSHDLWVESNNPYYTTASRKQCLLDSSPNGIVSLPDAGRPHATA